MKSTDIPQLYKSKNKYDVELAALIDIINRWKSKFGFSDSPDFQRPLVWSSTDKTKFMEFLLKGGKCAPIIFNSPKFNTVSDKLTTDLPDTVLVVDGKQRLNCILDFLSDKVTVFNGHVLSDFEDAEKIQLTIWIPFEINYLRTKQDLIKWYLELNEGHKAHSHDEIVKVKHLLAKEHFSQENKGPIKILKFNEPTTNKRLYNENSFDISKASKFMIAAKDSSEIFHYATDLTKAIGMGEVRIVDGYLELYNIEWFFHTNSPLWMVIELLQIGQDISINVSGIGNYVLVDDINSTSDIEYVTNFQLTSLSIVRFEYSSTKLGRLNYTV